MMLLAAMIAAPLVGFAADMTVAHRVELEALPIDGWEHAKGAVAVCGVYVKLASVDADGRVPVSWTYLRTRGTTVKRCPDCRVWKAAKR